VRNMRSGRALNECEVFDVTQGKNQLRYPDVDIAGLSEQAAQMSRMEQKGPVFHDRALEEDEIFEVI
jgi:hypothetical protein